MLTSIDNKLIEDTILKNYQQIALNIKHKQIMNADIEITELEESKSESNQYDIKVTKNQFGRSLSFTIWKRSLKQN